MHGHLSQWGSGCMCQQSPGHSIATQCVHIFKLGLKTQTLAGGLSLEKEHLFPRINKPNVQRVWQLQKKEEDIAKWASKIAKLVCIFGKMVRKICENFQEFPKTHQSSQKKILVGGFNPFEKYESKWVRLSLIFGVKNSKRICELPPPPRKKLPTPGTTWHHRDTNLSFSPRLRCSRRRVSSRKTRRRGAWKVAPKVPFNQSKSLVCRRLSP